MRNDDRPPLPLKDRIYNVIFWILLFIVVLGVMVVLSGCSGPKNKPLTKVERSDPVFVLNNGRWSATVNDLTQPPPAAHAVATQPVTYP